MFLKSYSKALGRKPTLGVYNQVAFSPGGKTTLSIASFPGGWKTTIGEKLLSNIGPFNSKNKPLFSSGTYTNKLVFK